MAAKHTPGPWVIKDAKLLCHSSCGCKVFHNGFCFYWNRCDLHSSSLDLLEALKDLYADYKKLGDSGDAGYFKLEKLKVGKKALAAIAKAEGRKP